MARILVPPQRTSRMQLWCCKWAFHRQWTWSMHPIWWSRCVLAELEELFHIFISLIFPQLFNSVAWMCETYQFPSNIRTPCRISQNPQWHFHYSRNRLGWRTARRSNSAKALKRMSRRQAEGGIGGRARRTRLREGSLSPVPIQILIVSNCWHEIGVGGDLEGTKRDSKDGGQEGGKYGNWYQGD